MAEVISAFSDMSEGSHSFALLMLFVCCIFVVICSGRSVYFSFWNVVLFVYLEYHVSEYCVCCMYVVGK